MRNVVKKIGIIDMNLDLLFENIERFIEIQFGECVDESSKMYIAELIKCTLEGRKYE